MQPPSPLRLRTCGGRFRSLSPRNPRRQTKSSISRATSGPRPGRLSGPGFALDPRGNSIAARGRPKSAGRSLPRAPSPEPAPAETVAPNPPCVPCPPSQARRAAVVVRAGDFIGSSTNLTMVLCTTLCLAAGRFGLAPTANKTTKPSGNGLELAPRPVISSGDPSGFSVVDVFAMGSAGHLIGAGLILSETAFKAGPGGF